MLTDRTRVRRRANRGAYDPAVIHAILDEALVCHVALPGPLVIPTTHVRIADTLYLHGAAASQMLTALADGIEACVAVTLLDALVLGRTAFHHSVNYRSVVMFGRARLVTDDLHKRRALTALVDKVAPGRSADCRPPDDHELAATKLVAFPIEEASAKIRTGPPVGEDGPDASLPFWSGIVPLVTVRGKPEPAPDCRHPLPSNLG
ncbi:MAG TPA: pyridoxamine 5'-phosphate oxidase family protein [Kofleriaceae bacterium]|nr:pyridoxamine 5'-phosphate oxidase family protein [Kofleriaceae bacterium]